MIFFGYRCASDEAGQVCRIRPNNPILAFSHSSNFTTYYLDLIYANGTVEAQKVTLNGSTGIKDVELYHNCEGKSYLILSDSRSTGGAIRIYDLDNMGGPLASVNTDDYSQELEIAQRKVYYAVQNKDEVRYFSLENPASPGTVQSIPVGKKPTNLLRVGNTLYVTNQDFIDMQNPTVSVISLWTNTVISTVWVGHNPVALLWDGETLWSYNAGYFNSSNQLTPGSISYDIQSVTSQSLAPEISLSGAQNQERPAFGGRMARAGGKNFATLCRVQFQPVYEESCSRYEFTKSGLRNRDNSRQYRWLGSHPNQLYEVYKEGNSLVLQGGSLIQSVILPSAMDFQFHILEN
ncbi:MAG: hypothetical protein NZM25_00525 [Leptospiraceae bacterium]|nr:hypothetical protein [Leptospiraceae bacterium]MDW8306209.1 hypothetical protein [Leptospiraceae bacterium]